MKQRHQTELSKKYRILGRVCYEAQTTGKNYDKNIEKLVASITDLNNELAKVNEMIARAENKIKCAECGTYNNNGAVFCSKCGEKLDFSEEEHMPTDDMIDFTEDNFEDDDLL